MEDELRLRDDGNSPYGFAGNQSSSLSVILESSHQTFTKQTFSGVGGTLEASIDEDKAMGDVKTMVNVEEIK